MIGVNSQIESTGNTVRGGQAGNVGIGFAIPSNTVKSVVSQLRATGKVAHAYLGVQTQDASAPAPRSAQVTAGGPAATGGLQPGDVITSVGGKSVEDSTALSSLVDAHKVGDQVKVDVTRNGAKKSLTVKLGQRPETTESDAAAAAGAAARDPRPRRRLVARRRWEERPGGRRSVPAPAALTGSQCGCPLDHSA